MMCTSTESNCIETDCHFHASVLLEITYSLSFYVDSKSDQCYSAVLLKKCCQQNDMSEIYSIYDLLKRCDRHSRFYILNAE